MSHDTDAQFDPAFILEEEKNLGLGPAYFDARAVAKRVMAKFENEDFQPMVKKVVDAINEKLWVDVQNSLLVDVEIDLHGEMWRMVDSCVNALLGGSKWALQKYALAERYHDGTEIRAAVAKHIPAELQDARIADLEAEITKLRCDIAFYRDRR